MPKKVIKKVKITQKTPQKTPKGKSAFGPVRGKPPRAAAAVPTARRASNGSEPVRSPMPKASADAKKRPTSNGSSSYGAKDIMVLEGLEPVRKRPGMYVGSTGPSGLHHLLWEIVDNGIDEALAGFAKHVEITLLPGGRARVSDDGRGIPVEKHPQTKKSTLETVLTTLHAGGKFGGSAYKVSGGLHGVGASVVNALSTYLKAEVCRDGGLWAVEFTRGKPTTKVERKGPCKKTGTTITFEPDRVVFHDAGEFDWKTIIDHLREQAYLTKGIHISIYDERSHDSNMSVGAKGVQKKSVLGENMFGIQHSFYFEGGVVSYVKYLTRHEIARHQTIFYVDKVSEGVQVEAAFRYTQSLSAYEYGFANNIHTTEGGMHVTGFRTALTRTLNDYARKQNYLKEQEDNLSGEDVHEGLTAIISVKLREPQFEGQTKAKLGNPEARTAVDAVVAEALTSYLEQYPQDARAILEQCIIAQKARKAAKAARDTVLRKGLLEGLALPGKLADCQSREPEESELYLVEGDSAGGCFSGDTKVALADGRNLSFEELAKEDQSGKRNYCYTIKADGSIGLWLITHPRLTKTKTRVLRVVLDNGEEIVCTPNHRFMMRDGSYKEAQHLAANDSLMPMRRQLSRMGKHITIKGYELVFDPTAHRWIFTHMLADAYNIEQEVYALSDGDHRHHVDFNKLNNNPENIRRMTKEAHLAHHAQLLEKTKEQWTPEFRAKRTRAYHQTYIRKALQVCKNLIDEGEEITKETYEEARRLKNDRSIIRYESICQRFFDRNEEALKTAAVNYNHKVKMILAVSERIDVYDLEVERTHNFALASGVFVHNSAKQARDRRFQAILPLRGKILNVERARLDRMLTSNEIKALIIALGTAVAEEFDLKKLRYQRIIFMTDADVDGAHIRTLLLTLFWRYFRPLIESGFVYIAEPPLYRIQAGKQVAYAYSDRERDEMVKEMQKARGAAAASKKEKIIVKMQGKKIEEVEIERPASADGRRPEPMALDEATAGEGEKVAGVSIQRYKGLGEMNPEQLWETTMDPARRVMRKVTFADAKKADEVFETLMGDDVLPRKRFISTHATRVKNLDI